ncbi:hypothetical protein EV128_10449 [Rhizobium azibense]|nr:hypothetical protein EV128_10449 [Rhizobium azibense]
MLPDLQIVPGIKQQPGPQYRRQTLGLLQHDQPFVKPLVFVPVEIVDQRILGPSCAGRLCFCNGGDRQGQHRIDGGELGLEWAGDVRTLRSLPFRHRIVTMLGSDLSHSAVVTKRWYRPSLPAQGGDAPGLSARRG